ncbi:Homogentisate 1,2-dioxygenase OS=Bosea thiooxidans OX=53254 GN=hmgA PE=3 SV=1 [Bosea thiooxidans]
MLTFVTGLHTVTTAGDADSQAGMAAHLLFVTASMQREYMFNADGEYLVVMQEGRLRFFTEFGIIEIEPGEICVIPRGVVFRVELLGGPARAYVCENYGGSFTLPDRGPIGANCLANPRDFLTPVAAYEDREEPSTLHAKWGGELYATPIDQSPLDVVALHGNYAPYKYDLRHYSPGDLLRSSRPVDLHGADGALGDGRYGQCRLRHLPGALGRGREHLPAVLYHRNIMSEFMGLIYGVYDAKPEGFTPGGFSLHNMMLPHGPDASAYEHASTSEQKPVKLTGTMAFMFETRFAQRLTGYAARSPHRQPDYVACWDGLREVLRSDEAGRVVECRSSADAKRSPAWPRQMRANRPPKRR